jgi:LemA protein
MKTVLILLVVVLALGGCSYVSMRNSLVTMDENVNNAWAQVETVLQRRYDLIPNLVNTVKGYAKHESGVFEEVTRLRSQWGEAKTPEQKAGIASMLEGAMGRLMVVVENYPELKANENFIRLQDELAGTENRINVERQRYNTAVQGYNVAIRKMPRGFFARLFGFETRTPFEAAPGAETAPTVQF